MEKCPKCGNYMAEGFAHAGRGMFFSKDPYHMTVFPNRIRGDVGLIGVWKGRRPAWYCEACQLLMFPKED